MKFLIASDNIIGKSKDRRVLNQVCEKLRKQGHEVKNCGVGPNNIQRNSQHEKGTYTSVQIVGGIDGQVYSDYVKGIKQGYYTCKEFYTLVCSWYFPPSSHKSKKGLKTYRMVQAHDAGRALLSMYKGMTVAEFMKKYPMIHVHACDTVDEMASILANGSPPDDDSKNDNKEVEKEQQKTYRDVINELLAPIKNLVEVKFVSFGDSLQISKAKHYNQQKEILWADETLNLVDISSKAYNPNTINTVVVKYGEKKYITVRDNLLVQMFGEKKVEITAEKYVVKDEKYMKQRKLALLERQDREEQREEKRKEKAKEAEKKAKNKGKSKKPKKKSKEKQAEEAKKEKEKEKEKRKKMEEEATDYDKNSTYGTVKISEYDEALDFAYSKFYENILEFTEPIDLTVIGSEKYVVGKWIKINNPRNGYVGDMVITGVKHDKSATTEWLTHLTCMGYYPHISDLEIKTEEKEMEKLRK